MRVHRDIDKVGTTVYQWVVSDEAPAGYDETGEPWYTGDRDGVASGEATRLATAKMCATNAARRHVWKPDHLASAHIDRVTYVRDDFTDPELGRIAWVDEERDDEFYCDGSWFDDHFDWYVEDGRKVAPR